MRNLPEQMVRAARLVRDAGHELRTPLTALRTNVEVLARAEGMPLEDRRKLLADVEVPFPSIDVDSVAEQRDDGDATIMGNDFAPGKSAVIRANGDVVETTELLEVRNLLGDVSFRIASPTVYTRFGDWLLLVAAAAAVGAIALPGGRRREAPTPPAANVGAGVIH